MDYLIKNEEFNTFYIYKKATTPWIGTKIISICKKNWNKSFQARLMKVR